MLDPAIQNFLDERKDSRIKEKSKTCKTDEDIQKVKDAAIEEFSLENWLPKAAKRAGSLSISTHPCTFTHPSSRKHPDKKQKTTGIIANSPAKADGFLRTGNSETNLDVMGDAAALDVHKFLSLKVSDGQTVLTHLEQNSDFIQNQFKLTATVPSEEIQASLFDESHIESFEEIQQGLLAMKQMDVKTYITSEKVKQVYFPVADDYHLLSILTPSGLMFKLKKQINQILFSDEAKEAREARKKQEHYSQGFSEIYGLTAIGFGGANKQNISMLNSQNIGIAYLLNSTPPDIQKRNLQAPKYDFFINSLYIKQYQESFETFHRLITIDYNNANIRQGRDEVISFIIMQVIEQSWSIRQLEQGWSETDTYNGLPEFQKIWLDNARATDRETDDKWLEKVIAALARWFIFAYEKNTGQKAQSLRDDELSHIKRIIEENKEGLL